LAHYCAKAIEQWLPIAGYEGYYSVSSLGNVRSEKRKCVNGPSRYRLLTERIMTLFLNQNGYLCVELCKESKRKTFLVHKLVASAFLGPAPDGLYVLHRSRGKTCNAVSNLCYGTLSKNDVLQAACGTID
jgi:hypothetical protein